MGVVSVVVCVGVAVLFCATEELIEKRATEKTIRVKRKTSEQTVRDYLQLNTDRYDDCDATWKGSFYGEWVSMHCVYCDKCTQKRLADNIVRFSDSHNMKK